MKSLIKAIDVLEALAQAEELELGVTELSRRTGIGKVIVHTILRTYVDRAFVVQNEDSKRYRLGDRLFELAGRRAEVSTPLSVARAHMRALLLAVQETVHFTVPSGNESVVLDIHESPQPVRFAGTLGQRAPLHCTASGKLFLAYGSEAFREQVLGGELAPFTDNTVIGVEAIRAELNDVRRQGYATDREEFLPQVNAVAAPVFDALGKCVAGIAVIGPAQRLRGDDLPTLSKTVMHTAAVISNQLKVASKS